jgi:hypothetical protein
METVKMPQEQGIGALQRRQNLARRRFERHHHFAENLGDLANSGQTLLGRHMLDYHY